MRKKIILAVTICTFVFSSYAYSGDNSISIKAGLLGAGMEVGRSFSDSISGRIGVNYFTYDYSATESDIEYNFDLSLKSLSVLLDWHPFQGSFRISGGVLYNGNKIEADAKSSDTYDIGDKTYTAEQVGTLDGKIDFDAVAPYLGLGWDTSFGKKNGFGFLFEIGAIYQGSPKADLSASGPIAGNQEFIDNLAKEESNLQSNLDDFKYYPVATVGLSYRF